MVALSAASPTQGNNQHSAKKTVPASAQTLSPRQRAAEALRLDNVGAALMGQQKFSQAADMFARAAALDPRLDAAELNRGIALVNLQKTAEARKVLTDFVKRHPANARAWYNLGLLNKNVGETEAALDAFEHAAKLAPADADAQYFVGWTESTLNQNQQAVAAFEKALELNRFHASAEFALARAYQRLGNRDAARQHLARFQELTRTKLGAPITLAYGDQGPLSLAEQARDGEPQVEPPIRVTFVSVSDEAGIPRPLPPEPNAERPVSAASACVFDFDGDGLPDLFAGAKLLHNSGGKFVDVTQRSGIKSPVALSCAAGDFDNDGRTDLAIASYDRIVLYRNLGGGKFQDVTESAKLIGVAGISSLTWVDYDHDGDLDLYVSTAAQEPAAAAARNVLWRNNGNGTFTDWTAETALNGASGSSISTVPTDFNSDRAIDLLATGTTTQLFLNPREGKWSAVRDLPGGTVAAATLDFDKDGAIDVALTFAVPPALRLFRNDGGSKLSPVPLPNLHWTKAWGVAAVDFDNDGWIDLIATGETSDHRGEIRLLRNEGSRGFRDVSDEVGLDKIALHQPRALVPVDYDNDGDTDLLVTERDGSVVLLRNDGGNRNHALRLALKGLNDNKSAVGTKIEVFAGELYQKLELTGAGYLGQSSTDVLIGLGKRQQADVVRLLWPTGVVQDEIDLKPGERHELAEVDRRASSCPVLFAWDGARYRSVSDMLGAGVVGHWIAPGQHNIPDPTEYVKIEDFKPAPQGTRLSFRLMEPMEEVVYLDQVRLLAIDHPAALSVYPNEYFASNPPFPEFRVVTSSRVLPVQAWDDKGHDVTDLLRARDRRYVAGFDLLPFKGFTNPHSLELDLGAKYEGGPLRLLLYGYIEYFTATSMYAADQAGVTPVAPYVEALDASGRWVRVLDDMGFPAGLPRTITVDLSRKVPPGARRLRITTNLQIYWDQILVDRSPPQQVRTTEVPLSGASLEFHGYPRPIEGGSPGDVRYVYEQVSRTGPYAREIGAYTRYGDVRDLLLRVDDRSVIFGSGEEVALDFDPSLLPSLPAGWKRDYFFFADGYEKDMDFYAADPLSVAPLPFHAMPGYPTSQPFPSDDEHLMYQLDFNTRFVSGREPPSYRFGYRQLGGNQGSRAQSADRRR
jgi:tetratricopeptide (TPR) repeat protein